MRRRFACVEKALGGQQGCAVFRVVVLYLGGEAVGVGDRACRSATGMLIAREDVSSVDEGGKSPHHLDAEGPVHRSKCKCGVRSEIKGNIWALRVKLYSAALSSSSSRCSAAVGMRTG